jgi:hypothetical protein
MGGAVRKKKASVGCGLEWKKPWRRSENFGNGEKAGVIEGSVPLGANGMIAVFIRAVVELSG